MCHGKCPSGEDLTNCSLLTKKRLQFALKAIMSEVTIKLIYTVYDQLFQVESFLRSGGDVNERKGDGSTGLVGLSKIFNSLSKIYFDWLTSVNI